jgi:hypothetical protein
MLEEKMENACQAGGSGAAIMSEFTARSDAIKMNNFCRFRHFARLNAIIFMQWKLTWASAARER